MNPEQLRAFLERNKVALGAAGAAAVAGLAFVRSRSSKPDAAAAAAPALPALGSALSAGGAPTTAAPQSYYPVSYVGASGGYDSSSSDVYNAIQPQLEALQNMVQKQSSPIPVTAPSYSSGYYAIAGDPDGRGAVYYVDAERGTRDYLTGKEWASMGLPEAKHLGINDPLWTQMKLIGAEAPNAKSWWTGKPDEPKV